MNTLKIAAATISAVALMSATASAQQTKLRIQTHFSQETLSGQMAEKYIDDITAMSNGEIPW